jgi:hypothetical protein
MGIPPVRSGLAPSKSAARRLTLPGLLFGPVLLLAGLLLTGAPAPALEPVSENHETIRFDVEGGYVRSWTRRNIAPPPGESPPYEMRFVITGINPNEDWSSMIGFFFRQAGADDEAKTDDPGKQKEEFVLRFTWSESRRAIDLTVSVFLGGKEKRVARNRLPAALNAPVTLTVKRRNADTLMILVNGEDVFLNFSGRLDGLMVAASGVTGEMSLRPE